MKFLRKLWRWVFFPLVCLVTLVALIIAEENLRGKLAWESCKRDLEAQGEHLDMAWFIPPPVPDDQNFAMAPLLKPLFFDSVTGKPDDFVRKQPLDIINVYAGYGSKESAFPKARLTGWQTGNPRDMEVWQTYYRRSFPDLTLSQSAAEDVVTTTDKLNGVFAELRDAAKTRPFSRFSIQYDKGVGANLPHISALKNLVIILSIRATAELRLNRAGDAYEDVQLAFHLIDAIRDEPFLISGLVRIGQTAALMGPIWEGIATHRWSDEQLTGFRTEFQRIDWLSDYCRGIRFERTLEYQAIRMVSENPRLISPLSKSENAILACLKLLPGWMWQNFVSESQWLQESISSVDVKAQRVDVPRELREKESLEEGKSTPYTFLGKLCVVSVTGPFQKFAVAQAWTNEAVIACEIERYRLAHGTLPASLDDLHMANLPHDVINGEPLHYRVTGPDNYILYSVGWNGTDDGGKVVTKGNGSADFTKGDWVWSLQPVEQER